MSAMMSPITQIFLPWNLSISSVPSSAKNLLHLCKHVFCSYTCHALVVLFTFLAITRPAGHIFYYGVRGATGIIGILRVHRAKDHDGRPPERICHVARTRIVAHDERSPREADLQ